MVDLRFHIDSATPVAYSAVPQIAFALRIVEGGETPIQSIALHTQIRIEPTKRAYSPEMQEQLRDLFGAPTLWARSVHSMLWTHVDLMVPGFSGTTRIELPVPCSFDFNVAATKYFAAIDDGEIPLSFLFSGSVFYQSERGLQVSRISWEKEAAFRLPAATWRAMMDRYYPGEAWMCLPRESFERLECFKREHGLTTWEQVMKQLLSQHAEATP